MQRLHHHILLLRPSIEHTGVRHPIIRPKGTLVGVLAFDSAHVGPMVDQVRVIKATFKRTLTFVYKINKPTDDVL